MDRTVLRHFLRAGPCRCYDVSSLSRMLPDDGLPFAAPFLNRAVLFKINDASDQAKAGGGRRIETLVYLPFDVDRPADGGESFIYNAHSFAKVYASKLTAGDLQQDALAADLQRLQLLDGLPTFSPFLVDLAFRRAGLPASAVAPQLTPELRNRLSQHLRSRLRPLIVAAFSRVSANVETAVESLTGRLLLLRDANDVLPLIQALRLPPDSAAELIGCWLGMAYYEYEYAALQAVLAELAGWLRAYTGNGGAAPGQYRSESCAGLVDHIRGQVRQDWNDIVAISKQYRATYELAVFKGKIGPLLEFITHSRAHFWKMGEMLGRLEQTVLVWRQFFPGGGRSAMPFGRLYEMLNVLRHLYPDTTPAPGARARAV